MQSLAIKGCSPPIGRAQGYNGLHIKHDVEEDGTPTMTSAWEPTPAELKDLNEGASIHLVILGNIHPPVSLQVGVKP